MSYTEEDKELEKFQNAQTLIASNTSTPNEQKAWISVRLYKKCKIKIYKPLIALKIILFLYFTAAYSVTAFYTVFLKHRGITKKEITLIYMISAVFQFLSVTINGVLADKFGRIKPFFYLHIYLSIVVTMIMIFMPSAANIDSPSMCRKVSFSNISLMYNCEIDKELTESYNDLNSSRLLNHVMDCDKDFNSNASIIAPTNHTFPSNETNCSLLPLDSEELPTICCNASNSSNSTKFQTNSIGNFWDLSKYRNVLVLCYAILQIMSMITIVSLYRVLDIVAMVMSKEHNTFYSYQRLYAMLGALFGPLLSSLAVYINNIFTDRDVYKAVFYSYIILLVVISIIVFNMDVKKFEPNKKFWKKAIFLLKQPDVFFFALILFVCGAVWAFDTYFSQLHLDELGAPPHIIGLTQASKHVIGLLFIFMSNWYLKTVGYSFSFIIALIAWIAYLFGYSFLQTTWPAFLLSVLYAFTYTLFWISVVNYCHDIAPKGLHSTVNSVAGSIHFVSGRLTGSAVGGMIMSSYGGRTAYQIMAYICIGTLSIYTTYIMFRRKFRAPI